MNYAIEITCGCGATLMQSSMAPWHFWCMNNECVRCRKTLKLKLEEQWGGYGARQHTSDVKHKGFVVVSVINLS